uniref:Uncharacterized protein n=1 Tax=Nelumbo nucifera TaxID=4432 RepID=A0A822YNK9_NELNU|nr:TPA_asm: hypothetical protein HUJ06_006404 [Nelumbo nucifera]
MPMLQIRCESSVPRRTNSDKILFMDLNIRQVTVSTCDFRKMVVTSNFITLLNANC